MFQFYFNWIELGFQKNEIDSESEWGRMNKWIEFSDFNSVKKKSNELLF